MLFVHALIVIHVYLFQFRKYILDIDLGFNIVLSELFYLIED
jgi:hypothetical protein